ASAGRQDSSLPMASLVNRARVACNPARLAAMVRKAPEAPVNTRKAQARAARARPDRATAARARARAVRARAVRAARPDRAARAVRVARVARAARAAAPRAAMDRARHPDSSPALRAQAQGNPGVLLDPAAVRDRRAAPDLQGAPARRAAQGPTTANFSL